MNLPRSGPPAASPPAAALRGGGWMLLSCLFFACMGVCIKLASAHFHAAELIFWRGLVGMVMLAALARRQGVGLATRYPGMHAWRSLIGVASMGAWFYAIAHLPLATAVTLNYMSSVWMAVFILFGSLATWRPGRASVAPPQGALVATVLAGFGGVVMVLRPSLAPQELAAGVVGLLSGITAAMAYMQVTALSRMGEPESRTVFYFALGSAVAGGAAALVEGFSSLATPLAAWLLPIGVLAALGQLSMTRAYASAGSSRGMLVIANLQYAGIVFAAVLGIAVFGDHIAPVGWAGMAVIIASGIAASALRRRAAPSTSQETTP